MGRGGQVIYGEVQWPWIETGRRRGERMSVGEGERFDGVSGQHWRGSGGGEEEER